MPLNAIAIVLKVVIDTTKVEEHQDLVTRIHSLMRGSIRSVKPVFVLSDQRDGGRYE